MNGIKKFFKDYWWLILAILISLTILPENKLKANLASACVAGLFGGIIVLFNKLSAKSSESNRNVDKDVSNSHKIEVKNENTDDVKKCEENECGGDKANNKKLVIFLYIILIMIGFWALTSNPSNNRPSSYNTQKINDYELQNITSEAATDLNEMINKSASTEKLQAEIKNQARDNENAAASAFDGFILSAEITREYCKSTGFIPEKYIKLVNSYKKDIDIESKLMEPFTKLGATKEQALLLVKQSRQETKKLISRLIDKEYKEIKREDPSYTKKDHCKIYDLYAEDIVSSKINEIKSAMPNSYEKYFK